MPASTGSYRLITTVPGARKIKIRQQKRGWDPATAQTVRRYEDIKACTSDRCVKRLNTGKFWQGGIHYEWQDKVRIVATFGRGALENTKTWSLNIREDTETVFECNSCIEAATPSSVHPRPEKQPLFTSTPTLEKWAETYDPQTHLPIYEGGSTTFTLKDTVTITTDSEGERIAEVMVVEGLQKTTPDEDIEETVAVAEEEIDAIVDDGIIVEIPEEVTVVIDSVDEVQTTPAAPQLDRERLYPELDRELVYPGAGAAVGAVAGKLLGESPLLGGIVGGVAGWWLGRQA